VSGYFKFENGEAKNFLAPLPPLIHIRAEGGHSVPWLEATLRFLASESTSDAPGAQTVVARLTDVLFIRVLSVTSLDLSYGEPSVRCRAHGLSKFAGSPKGHE
jgi:hypothetical protein